MTNAADAKDVARRDRKARWDAEQLEIAWKRLLAEEWGRRIVWDLMTEAHVFKTSMTGNSHTFFLEGERNIGLKVLDRVMRVDAEAFPRMQREAQAEPQEPAHAPDDGD